MNNPSNKAGIVSAKGIRLSRGPGGDLILTRDGGESFAEVQALRAAPLSQPNRYICFLDSTGQEICMIRDLADLSPSDRLLVEESLLVRYLTSEIRKVLSVRREAGTLYYRMETDRGARDLVVQTSDDSVRWITERRLLLIDVDGNRFQVSDIGALDARSARMLTDNLS